MSLKLIGKLRLYTILFLFGGAGYCVCELLWRESTHWSMAICGGVSFCFIYLINKKLGGASIIKQAFICALFITTLELAFGFILNILMGANVWDYSMNHVNFMGQICPYFSLIWFSVSFPCLVFCRFFRKCLEE